MGMKVLFTRHGESEANVQQIFWNQPGKYGLTNRGKEQAQALADTLTRITFSALYCSPVLRAVEIDADIILKATRVDGVYSADPEKDPSAELYHELCYMDILQKRLRVMDATAISLCMENDLPLIVFNIAQKDNIRKIVMGEPIGTLVKEESNGKGAS